MIFLGYVRNGKKKEVVRFWEGFRSPSGSCGSRNYLKKYNSKNYGRILMKFSENDQLTPPNINANGRF